jgi:hypothetical protein
MLEFTYASSRSFVMEDQQPEKPWLTRRREERKGRTKYRPHRLWLALLATRLSRE